MIGLFIKSTIHKKGTMHEIDKTTFYDLFWIFKYIKEKLCKQ